MKVTRAAIGKQHVAQIWRISPGLIEIKHPFNKTAMIFVLENSSEFGDWPVRNRGSVTFSASRVYKSVDWVVITLIARQYCRV